MCVSMRESECAKVLLAALASSNFEWVLIVAKNVAVLQLDWDFDSF